MLRVPFKIPSLYADLGEAEGVLSMEDDHLSIEIQTRDAIIGLIKSGVKEINIPISELAEVLFESKLFSKKLVVRGRKMSTLSKIPGCESGELKLNIDRKNKDAATAFATDIGIRIQEERLKRIDSEE